MANNITKKDRKLGFESDNFKLIVTKPKGNSVWYETQIEAGEHEMIKDWKEEELAEAIAKRFKATIEAFIDSSFEAIVLVGKVLKSTK